MTPTRSLRCLAARLPAVLFVLSVALLQPGIVAAQTRPADPRLSFRDELDLQLLGDVTSGFWGAPSLLVTLRRRNTLRRSTILSGLLLRDALSNALGGAVGQTLTFRTGSSLLEPFAEAGAVYWDARKPDGTYRVVASGGTGSQLIHRYRIVQGPAAVVGAGVSWSTMVRHRTGLRLALGYWRLSRVRTRHRGSVRLGVSLTLARGHDARWYTLRSDRTAPAALVFGQGPPEGDSLYVAHGTIRVLASDADGIARIRVNRANVGFLPMNRTSASDVGLGANAVVATVEIRKPFDGRPLNVAVSDSAGLTTRLALWTYAAPDRAPPAVTLFRPSESADTLDPRFRAVAHDPSGIADAHIGVCPVGLVRPSPRREGLVAANDTIRLVRGWGAPGNGLQMTVRDRAGNVARIPLPSPAPEIPADAPPPTLTDLTATAGATVDSLTSVRVRGTALDRAGAWIARVKVNGEPAVMSVGRDPSRAGFDGWLLVDRSDDTVTVTASTVDGRTVRTEVPISRGDQPAPGRLHTFFVIPDVPGDSATRLVALARQTGDDDPKVLAGTQATPSAILNALSELQRQVGPEDAVVVYLEGTLVGSSGLTRPSLRLSLGWLDLGRVDRILEGLHSGVTVVSTSFKGGRTWSALPTEAPGAPPPAGCYEDDAHPQGSVVGAGPSAPVRILAGIAGAADRNGDGRVLTTELLTYLGVSPRTGLLDFDPLLTVSASGGAR